MQVRRERDCDFSGFSENSDTDTESCSVKASKTQPFICSHSEGYGTEEECVQSLIHSDSDADADVEDTDSRLLAGSLQRISSRKRKRQRITRQDTTESEDDSGRSHTTYRWSLRHSRAITEESVSQVRPLVVCPRVSSAVLDDKPASGKLLFIPHSWLLLFIPLSIIIIIIILFSYAVLTNT